MQLMQINGAALRLCAMLRIGAFKGLNQVVRWQQISSLPPLRSVEMLFRGEVAPAPHVNEPPIRCRTARGDRYIYI